MTWLLWGWSLLKRLWAFLRAVPWQVYAGLAVLVALWWFGANRYEAGEAAADERHRIADEKDRLAAEAAAAAVGDAQTEVTTRVETVYVDRIKTVREAGKTIIREVPVYVPATDPDLSGGFRLLHDAAAAGVPGVSVPAYIADAAAVPAQVAAGTIADNYGTCLETAAQLSALQTWVREQKELVDGNRN